MKENNFLRNKLDNESQKIYEQIIENNNQIKSILEEEVIKNNINYDLSRKIVLENVLDNYKEYIFSNTRDINFIYNYKINYITIPINKIIESDRFNEILILKNYNQLNNFIQEENIEHFIEQINKKNFNKINKKIKNLTNSSNKFSYQKNTDFIRIINIEKKIDASNGVFYRLINIETNRRLNNNEENCEFANSYKEIKSANEYELNKLNDRIKSNLISINDFIIFQNKDLYNYIFLCEIRVNEDFLKEININKKISFIENDIELDFINKYSKLFKTKKY